MKAFANWWTGAPLPLPGPKNEGTASLYPYLAAYAPPLPLVPHRTPDATLPWLEQIVTATSTPQLYVETPKIHGVQSQTRHLRFTQKQQTVIDTLYLEDAWFFRLNHITVEPGSTLTWVVLPQGIGQSHCLQSTHFHLGKGSTLKLIQFQGAFTLNHHHQFIHLNGEGARLEEHSLFFPTQDHNLCNYHSQVIAKAPNASIDQQLRSAAFRGKIHIVGNIHIQQTATNTDANFNHQGVILSEKAAIQAYPQLHIDTDAVRCTHSNGISPLDTQVLQYIESRGWSSDAARNLYLISFLSPVTKVLTAHPKAKKVLVALNLPVQ